VTVCPEGQLKPSAVALGGVSVSDPVMFPFLSAVNVPLALTGDCVVVLFDAH
jgi:hypothetical protein